MTQLNDAYADIPLADRIALFEGHLKPFGKDIPQRFIIGKKYAPLKDNGFPACTKYNPDRSLEYLRAHRPSAKLTQSLHLWRKSEDNPSVRPEVNDAWMKPFGASARGIPR